MKDLSTHPSVLLNKISKAHMMITHYAYETPEEYGRTHEQIATSLEQWKSHRDQLIAAYRATQH